MLRRLPSSLILVALATACSKGSREPGAENTGGDAGSSGSGAGTAGSGAESSGGSAGMGAEGGGGGSLSGGESSCDNQPTDGAQIDTPNPLISVGVEVASSSGVENAQKAADGFYHSSPGVRFGAPSEQAPEWVALRLTPGPTRLLLTWADAGWNPYNVVTGGAPASYRIEVSGDSTDGEDGSWRVVATVVDNPVRTRGHSFAFDELSWVRLVVTGASEGNERVEIDEVALYDISGSGDERPQDTWFFMGDSIVQAAHQRDLGNTSGFDVKLNEQHTAYQPALLNGGIGGEFATDGVAHLEEWLALNPDFQNIAIGYGTNDAWGNKDVEDAGFEETLRTLIETLLEDGRMPYLGRIPYASAAHTTLPDFNAVIDALTAEYGLPCGPDFYTWFRDHPEELGNDGVHPNRLGNISINRLWAETVGVQYVDP